MAVYDKNGNLLTAVYDKNGNSLSTVYDKDGNAITITEPILLSDIPEYWQADMTNALTYIDGLGDDYVNYIVVTDTHYELSNTRHTPILINYLYQEGNFDKMIHLGDIVDGGGFDDTGWERLVEDDWWHFSGNWLFTQGNHDSAWSTSLATLASYFETTDIRYTVDSKHNIFYYDNDDYGIRIIGSHHYSFMDDTDTLNAYVAAAVNRGYKWMIIGHYKTEESGTEWRESAVETYGNFICSLSGHAHTDAFTTISTGTKTMLDINLEADIQGRAYAGTNQEQCITLVSINPTDEILKLYRIGLSRVYDATQWEYTDFGN